MTWPTRLRLRSIAALACIGALATARAQAAPFNDPSDVKAITAIEQALATQTDMKSLIGYYAPNAFVEDAIAPGIYRGRGQIEASFAKQFAPVKSMQGKILDTSIASDGAFACAATRARFHTVMKDGSKLVLSTRQLDAFKKIDKKWQIIQEQISLPMDPKTGMGVMDANLPVRGSIVWSQNPFPGPATTPALAKTEIRKWVITGSPVIDIDEMVGFFGPTDDVLLYDLTLPGEYRNHREIHDAYAPLLSTLSSAKDQLLMFAVDSDGKFGVQIDTQKLTINGKNGSSNVVAFRESDCLSHVGGKWRTVMEMLSFPVDPKTGKAITTAEKN